MVTINLNGNEYPLACNLRVAYVLQNQHNHESYSSILSRIGEMPLEQQIDVLYAAFQIANPETAKTFTREMFRTYVLDHDEFNASVILQMIKKIISGILGKELPDEPTEEQDSDKNAESGEAKN